MSDFCVAKCQTHPLSGKSSVVPLKFRREIARGSHSEARKGDKNTANTQQVRFFKLYFDFNVVSAENRRLFSIEFQLHTDSYITLWLLVIEQTGMLLQIFTSIL